ncbi:MAG: A/G-specific adenine glycosylase [Candidatus Cyclobacteriaceae bacterium M3_2C_046]
MDHKGFVSKIINWYQQHKRDLPWRNTNDPYLIWLSEIILQQTRIDQGLPYYQKFIKKFPTLQALAKADPEDVLRLWQGLGYYSRARNLHYCAQTLQTKYQGIFPKSYKELQKLKGIGSYTAAAIASFSYLQTVPVLDGNVFRVLSRIFGIREEISSSKGKKVFFELAQQLIPSDQPDIFNQAMMEFGALYCTPGLPDCNNCIFRLDCYAYQHQQQQALPVKQKKIKSRKRIFHYLMINENDQFYFRKRMEKDIWQGLYNPFLIEKSPDLPELTDADLPSGLRIIDTSAPIRHILTHQVIHAQFHLCSVVNPELLIKFTKKNDLQLYSLEELDNLPKPVLVTNYLNELVF